MPTGIKAKKEPSLIAACVMAVIMAFFGLLLGMVYLTSFPLESYTSMAEQAKSIEDRATADPIPGEAFYIEGPVQRSASWAAKRAQLLHGGAGELVLSAGEINAWLAAQFRPVPGRTSTDDTGGMTIVPGEPNVAVTKDGVFYVNLPATISAYGFEKEYMISATGRYGSGAPAAFKIRKLMLEGARVPLPTVFGGLIVKTVLRGYADLEEFQAIREAWTRVDAVAVAEGGLKLSLL